jgi:hypothetical protein
VDDDLDRAQQLCVYGRRSKPRQSAQGLETSHDVGRGVGVQGAASAIVTCVERGQHLAHLSAPDLTHDQPIGTHPQ